MSTHVENHDERHVARSRRASSRFTCRRDCRDARPLICCSLDFYVRVFVRVFDVAGAKGARQLHPSSRVRRLRLLGVCLHADTCNAIVALPRMSKQVSPSRAKSGNHFRIRREPNGVGVYGGGRFIKINVAATTSLATVDFLRLPVPRGLVNTPH